MKLTALASLCCFLVLSRSLSFPNTDMAQALDNDDAYSMPWLLLSCYWQVLDQSYFL